MNKHLSIEQANTLMAAGYQPRPVEAGDVTSIVVIAQTMEDGKRSRQPQLVSAISLDDLLEAITARGWNGNFWTICPHGWRCNIIGQLNDAVGEADTPLEAVYAAFLVALEAEKGQNK